MKYLSEKKALEKEISGLAEDIKNLETKKRDLELKLVQITVLTVKYNGTETDITTLTNDQFLTLKLNGVRWGKNTTPVAIYNPGEGDHGEIIFISNSKLGIKYVAI